MYICIPFCICLVTYLTKNWVTSCTDSLCVVSLSLALVLKSHTLQGNLVPSCKYSTFTYVFLICSVTHLIKNFDIELYSDDENDKRYRTADLERLLVEDTVVGNLRRHMQNKH